MRRDLQQAFRKKRPDVPTERFILHQDNVSPHIAITTQLEIGVLELRQMSHLAYSPDVAPLDFAFFPDIKSKSKGYKFDHVNQLQKATNDLLKATVRTGLSVLVRDSGFSVMSAAFIIPGLTLRKSEALTP